MRKPYRETSAKNGQRETLSQAAKDAYVLNEGLTTKDLGARNDIYLFAASDVSKQSYST